jgi:hypothetical protein
MDFPVTSLTAGDIPNTPDIYTFASLQNVSLPVFIASFPFLGSTDFASLLPFQSVKRSIAPEWLRRFEQPMELPTVFSHISIAHSDSLSLANGLLPVSRSFIVGASETLHIRKQKEIIRYLISFAFFTFGHFSFG